MGSRVGENRVTGVLSTPLAADSTRLAVRRLGRRRHRLRPSQMRRRIHFGLSLRCLREPRRPSNPLLLRLSLQRLCRLRRLRRRRLRRRLGRRRCRFFLRRLGGVAPLHVSGHGQLRPLSSILVGGCSQCVRQRCLDGASWWRSGRGLRGRRCIERHHDGRRISLRRFEDVLRIGR